MTRRLPLRYGRRVVLRVTLALLFGVVGLVGLLPPASTPLHAQEGATPPHWIWHPSEGQPDAETRYFRKEFSVKEPSRVAIDVTADNRYTLYLDGEEIAAGDNWKVVQAATVEVPTGTHVLAAVAENEAPGAAGFLLRGGVLPLGQGVPIHSDASWKSSATTPEGDSWLRPGFNDAAWVAAADLGILGTGPWQDLVFESGDASDRFTVPEGLTITAVAAPSVTGSAVSFAFDDQGRPCVGVERGPIVRLIDADNDGTFEDKVAITPQMSNCQGLYFDVADDGSVTLWAVGDGPDGTGIHQLADNDGDEVFETVLHYVPTDGMGEHGPHAVTRGPDGALYFNAGNHAHIKDPIDPRSPVNETFNYEGELLPHYPDARGHAATIMAPGGEIYRSTDDGKTWSRIVAGFRNEYDFAFNRDGEIFSFDSDMEWDLGLPWYRPVRVNHCPIGAEFGWRNGSGKWPAYYYDSLPGIIDVGRGSPTGVTFLHSAWFPAEYDDNFLICDWSQGRILAIALERDGAGYTAKARNLVTGQPLNCTDIEVGPDGAVYFTTGGRGTLGGLFRVAPRDGRPSPPFDGLMGRAIDMRAPLTSYARRQILGLRENVGRAEWPRSLVEEYARNADQPARRRVRAMDLLQQFEAGNDAVELEPLWIELAADADATVRAKAVQFLGSYGSEDSNQALTGALGDADPFVRRRAAEALILSGTPIPVESLLPLLSDPDRLVRHSARVALEHAGAEAVRGSRLLEATPRAILEWMLAVVRTNRPEASGQNWLLGQQAAMLAQATLAPDERLDLLRLIGLTYLLGTQKPADTPALASAFREQALAAFPSGDRSTDWELARLLAFLNEPKAVAAILDAQAAAGVANDRPSQIHYAYCLRAITDPEGWTPDAKGRFWAWFEDASHWDGGFSFLGYLDFMVQELVNQLSPDERASYLAEGAAAPFPTRVLLRALDPAGDPAALLALADLYRELDPAANPGAVFELRGLIVEKLGQSPRPEAHAALRSLAYDDPARRDSIARALAESPTADDLPLLLAALESNDRNTLGAVAMGLRRVEANPDGPEALRSLILAARRMSPNFAPQLNALASKWTGADGPGRDADLAASLRAWEAVYAERFPSGPPLTETIARRAYTLDELVSEVLDSPVRGNAVPDRGRALLTQAQCLNCHKFGAEGQGLGPDLTTLSSRFEARDILKAMVEPSAEISDQYKPVMVATLDGKILNGMPAGDDPENLILLLSDGTKVTIPKADIEEQGESNVSVMPEGLLDTLTPQQIADLIALFEAQPRVEVPVEGQ